jgi:hypothetical protein
MKLQLTLLALVAASWGGIHAAPGVTNAASTHRILLIDPSSMPVAAGKATLTIGALERTGGVYSGNYKIKVSPYFFKSEKGKLDIVVSDESLAQINQGKVTTIKGNATTSGKGGRSRHIDATATPANLNREMIFEPAYHFSEKETVAVLAQTNETNFASNLQRRTPDPHPEALEATAKNP